MPENNQESSEKKKKEKRKNVIVLAPLDKKNYDKFIIINKEQHDRQMTSGTYPKAQKETQTYVAFSYIMELLQSYGEK